MKRFVMGLAGLLLASMAFTANAQSPSDYSRGVESGGSAATIWFKSNVDTQWVDVHYVLAGLTRIPLRMDRFDPTAALPAVRAVQAYARRCR